MKATSPSRRRVFDAIGMPGTAFSFDRVRPTSYRTKPQNLTLAGHAVPLPLDVEDTVRPIATAGGAWSTANDMARYLITALNRGTNPEVRRVVSAQNLGRTSEPQVAVTAEQSYGLGWFV